MILLKILEHDLHRSKRQNAVPLFLETPAKPQFLPAIVSSSRGLFLVSRKLTSESKIRTGIFKYDSDRLDEIIGSMFRSAYELSKLEKWNNEFAKPEEAFAYIQTISGTQSQPHICLVPDSWPRTKLLKWAGKDNISESQIISGGITNSNKSVIPKYKSICKILPTNVDFPIFLSRPDFVGLYTQIAGGSSSILLHNIKNGIAFNTYGLHK
jgi:hypothetical protein